MTLYKWSFLLYIIKYVKSVQNLNISTKYAHKIDVISTFEAFVIFLLWIYLHKAHYVIKKVQLYI